MARRVPPSMAHVWELLVQEGHLAQISDQNPGGPEESQGLLHMLPDRHQEFTVKHDGRQICATDLKHDRPLHTSDQVARVVGLLPPKMQPAQFLSVHLEVHADLGRLKAQNRRSRNLQRVPGHHQRLIDTVEEFGEVGRWRQFIIQQGKAVASAQVAGGHAPHSMHQLTMTLYCLCRLMWNGTGLRLAWVLQILLQRVGLPTSLA